MAFPATVVCLICEFVRPELMGKFSLFGYFGVAPHVRLQIKNFGQPIVLCFVFSGGKGSGQFRVGLRITSPNGAQFDAREIEANLAEGANGSNIFMSFQGLLPGPGVYTATLLADGAQQFQTRFTLDQVAAAPVPTPPNALAAPGRAN